ncbi:hypothetical protein BC940DRAFT_306007 [Gongronella butleri]|nr:hypothetical protein BC940DRAFT_306007 [Gongronella butleri]
MKSHHSIVCRKQCKLAQMPAFGALRSSTATVEVKIAEIAIILRHAHILSVIRLAIAILLFTRNRGHALFGRNLCKIVCQLSTKCPLFSSALPFSSLCSRYFVLLLCQFCQSVLCQFCTHIFFSSIIPFLSLTCAVCPVWSMLERKNSHPVTAQLVSRGKRAQRVREQTRSESH